MKVVFSDRAMISLLVETREKITTETGGVFLGAYENDTWYVIETVDPGPKSVFTPTYFEYDVEYINHLINKLSRIYQKQLDLIGLWHRHPGSFDRFSGTDDGTNTEYARLSENGAISVLVNIDPEFRMTVYHVGYPLKYKKIEYQVGDAVIPPELKKLYPGDKLVSSIAEWNKRSKTEKRSAFSGLLSDRQMGISFGKALHMYLRKRTMADIKSFHAKGYAGELPVEAILDELAEDLEFLEKTGISFRLVVSEEGLLELKGTDTDSFPWKLLFGMDREQAVFQYNELTYKYAKGLFAKVMEEYKQRG